MKRLLSLVLALVLVIGSIPTVPALATETEPIPVTEPVEESAAPEQTQETQPEETTEPAPEETEAPVTEETAPEETEPTAEETVPQEPVPEEESIPEVEAAAAQAVPEGLQFTVSEESVTVTGYTGVADMLTIPDTIEGLPVTAIGAEAFYENSSLVEVTLPQTLKTIGSDAFHNCSHLKQVNIPDGVTRIGDRAFANTSLYSVFFPASLEEIGSSAFDSNCFWHALYAGTGEQWNAISIDSENNGLRNASMHFGAKGDEVKEVYKQDCTGTAVSHCDICGESLYTEETGLHSYTDGVCTVCGMPAGLMYELEDSGAKPYYRITGYVGSAKDLVIPATIMRKPVERISDYAFRNNSKLQTVTLPDSVTYVGWGAFEGCSALTSVQLSKSLKEIGNSMFTGCAKLTDIRLHEGIYSIGMRAFAGCSSLTAIDIPSTVQDISDSAFAGCSSLTQITLPENLRYLSSGVFADCVSLTSVNIPQGVTYLYGETFLNCRSLTSVRIPDGVTHIGWGEFEGCTNLRVVTIPGATAVIMPQAFAGCDQLWHVLYTGTQDQWNAMEQDASNDALAQAAIHFGAEGSEVVSYEENDCTVKSLFKCGICQEVLYDETFQGEHTYVDGVCTVCGDGEAVIPEGLVYETGEAGVTITDYTGTETELVIPGTIEGKPVTAIGNSAFEDCVAIKKITLPDGVTHIGDYAFRFCKKLTTITLPAGLDGISEGVFSGCHSLQRIGIPAGITDISFEAFYQCEALVSITLPVSVTTVDKRAFAECGSLKCVVYAGTQEQKNAISIGSSNADLKDATWHVGGTHCKVAISKTTTAASGEPKLTWDNLACMKGYEVYRATTAKGTYTLLATTTEPAFVDDTAVLGTLYYYKIVGISNMDERTAQSAYKSVRCICAQPKVTAQTDPTGGKPQISWEKVEGAKKYEVWRATSANGKYSKQTTTTKLSYTDTNVTRGKVYYYKVKAIAAKSSSNSAYSEVKSAGYICTQPNVNVTLSAASGRACLSWKKVTGASKYEIYRAYSEDGKYELVATQTALTFTDKAAPVDTECFYKVKAIASNAICNSLDSVPKSIRTTCAQPVVKTASHGVTGIPVISWEAVEGAVEYEVTRATKSSGTYTSLGTVTEQTFTDETAVGGKTYYYKVTAITASGSKSAASAYKSAKCKCAQPQITVELNAAKGKPQISWEKVSGAKKYEVWRATSENGKYSKQTTTSKLTYTDTKASVGKTYFYKVKAVASSSSYNSVYSAIESCKAICAQPVVTVKVNTTTGKPELSWKKVTGASQYEILRSRTADGDYKVLATQTGLTYKDTDAKADMVYYYKVNAVAADPANNSVDATPKEVTTTCAKPVIKTIIAGETSGKPAFDWDAVDGAACYEILRATKKNGTYNVIGETIVSIYQDNEAVAGKTYYYKVIAVGDVSRSAASAYKSVKCKCAQPVLEGAVNETGNPQITWEKVEGAKTYEIYRATSENGKYKKVTTTTKLTYTDIKAAEGKTYYYKVKAIASSSSANSVFSIPVAITAE